MPWKISKRNEKFCVVKYDGTVVKCHDTKAKATAHLRALYASESKSKKEEGTMDEKSWYIDESKRTEEYVPYAVSSFTELDAAERAREKGNIITTLVNKFKAIIDNIFYNEEIEDKASAIKRVTYEFESRLDEVKENYLFTNEKHSSFSLFKSADGWDWVAVWTNKYRDNDNPPEILSEASHLDFVQAVDNKEWGYPDLEIWHIPGSVWGKATFIDYDIDNGFTIAYGKVDKGMEPVAEAFASVPPEKLGVSHGMPRAYIERADDDPTVITRYRSKEISVLPLDRAANKRTGFLIGDETMNLSKSDRLKELLGEDRFNSISGLLDLKGKEAAESGVEYKETEEEAKETKEVEETKIDKTDKVDKEDVKDTKEEIKNSETKEDDEPITRKEVATAISDYYTPLIDSVISLKELLETLDTEVKQLQSQVAGLAKTDEEKIKETMGLTPRASISDLVGMSVIGRDAVLVDRRTKEGRDKPKETSPQNDSAFGGIIQNIIGGGLDAIS